MVKIPVVPQGYTLAELKEHDGRTPTTPIWIAVKGKIFDVSSKRTFYGPGGPYGLFAGRDASRALALNSLDKKDVENSSVNDVKDLSSLEEWFQTYSTKYEVVGWLEGK